VRRIIPAVFDPDDVPDPEQVYRNYLETCRRAGIEPVPRERVFGLIQQWNEILSGRPEPRAQATVACLPVSVHGRSD